MAHLLSWTLVAQRSQLMADRAACPPVEIGLSPSGVSASRKARLAAGPNVAYPLGAVALFRNEKRPGILLNGSGDVISQVLQVVF
jgi:hypothetical protein